jgi:putative membrane protein insertion efficiency factor
MRHHGCMSSSRGHLPSWLGGHGHRRGHARKRKRKSGRLDGCDGCDCDLPCCDFGLLSTSLLVAARAPMSERAALTAIRGYRRFFSPRVPVKCRFEPSCSAYALEAVTRHGTRAGLRLAAARLRRCRPGVPYGTHDPVPSAPRE